LAWRPTRLDDCVITVSTILVQACVPASLDVDQTSTSASGSGFGGEGASGVAAMSSLSWMYRSQFLVDQEMLRPSIVPASMDHARFRSLSKRMREAIRVRSAEHEERAHDRA
jgi:hypothetical protein